MRHFLLSLCLLGGSLSSWAAAYHDPLKLSRWGIPAANYSGITPFGEGRYAVVSDKEKLDGFYEWQIDQDAQTGQVVHVSYIGFHGQMPLDTNTEGISLRDAEDIVYCPQRSSFFICGEGYQDIIEVDANGQRTDYELPVPDHLRTIYPNYGFEALAYDATQHIFYTTTENTLPADGILTSASNHGLARLRIQSFVAKPAQAQDSVKMEFTAGPEYIYPLDMPRVKHVGNSYAHGVVAMTALGEGRVAVLEREAYVSQSYLGSWVYNKIYIINTNVSDGSYLEKQFVAGWDTHLRAFDYGWANYEGMCLGQPLPDGRQTLLLVSDSQGGYGIGPVHLNDYIRVIVL